MVIALILDIQYANIDVDTTVSSRLISSEYAHVYMWNLEARSVLAALSLHPSLLHSHCYICIIQEGIFVYYEDQGSVRNDLESSTVRVRLRLGRSMIELSRMIETNKKTARDSKSPPSKE